MRRLLLPAIVAMGAVAPLPSARAKAPPPRVTHVAHVSHGGRPAPPLPLLPVLTRVHVEVARDRLVVVDEVALPRAEWQSGDLDLFVAFGTPGSPRAFDARLFSAQDGDRPMADDQGDVVAVEPVPHRPVSAQVLLGRPQQAGAVLHVHDALLRRALAASDTALLRIRSLVDLPEEDVRTGREVLVRLGSPGDQPIALERIEFVSLEPRPWVTRVEANLCGPEADSYPLAVAVSPRPLPSTARSRAAASPPLMARHTSDDLCIRFWTS